MRASKHSIRRASVTALALYLAGCQPSTEETATLEAVDVEPALVVGTEDDQQAVERGPALSGIMPTDFPSDLPLYLPASLIDFGTRDGARYVSLLTSSSLSQVERELSELLRQQGWSLAEASGSKRLRKGAQQVSLRLENARPGTLYHFEY